MGNRYILVDLWGQVFVELDNFDVALRIKARSKIEDGRDLWLHDLKSGQVFGP